MSDTLDEVSRVTISEVWEMKIQGIKLDQELSSSDKIKTPEQKTNSFQAVLESYQQRWENIQSQSVSKIDSLAPESAELLGIQRELTSLALETELLTKVADGLGSTLRTIQQTQG